MHSAEARDKMVARVKATFAKYPSFLSLPEHKGAYAKSTVVTGPYQANYVAALHTLCADCEVLGRAGDAIVGK